MIPLNDFWNFLVYRPGLAALAEDWVRCLGDAGWAALRRDLFTHGDKATSYRSVADKHEYHIRKMADGSYAFISAVNGTVERKDLEEQQVRNVRVNVGVLRDRVARALDISSDPGRVTNAAHAIPVGSWSPVAGTTVPTFMILPPSQTALVQEVQRLIAHGSNGFLIFLPVTLPLEVELQQGLKARRIRVLSLDELVACDNSGAFLATKAWELIQNTYRQESFSELMVPAPPQYEFRKTGDHWTVRFDGDSTSIKDAIGNRYIARLLARPSQNVFAPDLLAATTGEAVARQTGSAGEQADSDAVKQAKDQYLELTSELDRAKRDNDLAAQSRLEPEIKGVEDYLRSVRGLDGRSRKASDDADKIRRAMTQAIGRTISSLREKDKLPAAARHLGNAIKTGLFMSYDPEEEVDWHL